MAAVKKAVKKTAAVKKAPAKKTATKAAPKFPKAIGACADLLYELRQTRLADQKEVDAIEAREKALKEHIIKTLPKSETSGVSGRTANVAVTKDTIARVEEWDKFYAHVKKTGDFDLLNRAINQAAVRERWDNGKKIPGVVPFPIVKVSCTKIGS